MSNGSWRIYDVGNPGPWADQVGLGTWPMLTGGYNPTNAAVQAMWNNRAAIADRMISEAAANGYRGYCVDVEGHADAATKNIFINLNDCIADVSPSRWQGEYFDNMNLDGDPIMVRDDGAGFLNFDWNSGSPASQCGVDIDGFSVRWTREINVIGGTYRFTLTSDDGFRLSLDNVLKLDKWFDQAPTTYTLDVLLTAGVHTAELAYYENEGVAVAKLAWEQIVTPCENNFDDDPDVDGLDLASFIGGLGNLNPDLISLDFGRTHCPMNP